MELALEEPLVVDDFVSRHILLHFIDVLGQGVVNKRFFALITVGFNKAVAVDVGVLLCKLGDVRALIAVLGEFDFVALENLQVTRLERTAELFNLVAGIVNVEFAVGGIACLVQHCRKAVTERSAARVAHVHRTRGVG